MRRLTVWAIWSVSWIFMNIMMANAGMIGYKSFGALLLECIISCIAACIFLKHKVLFIIGFVFMIIQCVMNFGLVSCVCLGMALLLLWVTYVTEETIEI